MIKFMGLYSSSDWAELFTLCANAMDAGEPKKGSQPWINIHNWLSEYAKAHDFPQPEENENWSDTSYIIKESIMFLEKFAENHHDDLSNRKQCQS